VSGFVSGSALADAEGLEVDALPELPLLDVPWLPEG